MIYNVSFDICALIISAFSLFIIISRKGLQRESNRLLMYAIIIALISAVFDIWSAVANSYVYHYSYLYRDILNYIFLFAHTSTAALFAWYMVSLLGLRPRFTPWLTALFFLPQTLGAALPLLLNPFFRWVFYYDAARIYSHGFMIYVLYATGYFYMLLCVYLAVRFRRLLLKSQRNMAFLLLIFSILPIGIQQFFMPHQLLELFFQSIGIFGFLTTVEDFDRIYNPATNTYNRTAFLHDIPLAKESDIPLSLLIVKLSRPYYWEIASLDTGYADAFLAKIAELLGKVSKKAMLYNCEHGHFAVLCSYIPNLSQSAYQCFSENWIYRGHDTSFPMQIFTVDISAENFSAEEILRIIDQPYLEKPSQPVIAAFTEIAPTTNTIPNAFSSDLQLMLDNFIESASSLTPAERNILQYYIRGHEISEIPSLAYISINTVRKHNKNIYRKLGVDTRDELLIYIDLLRRSQRLEDLLRLLQ